MTERFRVLADRHELETAIKYLGDTAEALTAAKFGAVLGLETPSCGLFNSAAAVEGAEAVSSLKPR